MQGSFVGHVAFGILKEMYFQNWCIEKWCTTVIDNLKLTLVYGQKVKLKTPGYQVG